MASTTGTTTTYRLPLPEGSVSRRINLEPILFAGGGRALLLQVAHPSVAAGVASFSDYRRDPWNRLFRTTDVMYKLGFGTPEQSARQMKVLAARHRRVQGVDETGRRYHALDPDLLVWVWATLADTSLEVYQRVFGRLSDDELVRFHQEQVPIAVACGAPEELVPDTPESFREYFDRVMERDLVVTADARDVLLATMEPPLPTPFRQLSGPLNAAITTHLLPPSVREAYDLPYGRRERQLARRFFALARLGRALPDPVRRFPSTYQLQRERPIHLRPVGGVAPGARILARRQRTA
jgi:uncharacterized protein (DUF2236 family)